ncbi:MAG: TIGR02391 family protein [Bryobacterales bacterium]|nr:TIGR02391 family protein [Bryobacterales bacterium]
MTDTEFRRNALGAPANQSQTFDPWGLLHANVVTVAKSRFDSGHYADSVEAALKDLNDRVRNIVKNHTGTERDGADLMNFAFSPNDPVIKLDNLESASGRDIQKGYMLIFSGSMTGIRNPKAHDNLTITLQQAIHLLFLASLLHRKLDDAMTATRSETA